MALPIRMAPGADQVWFTARMDRGLHVAQAVAHKWHALQIHPVALGNLLEQTGLGFAAMAALIRRVRAIKNGIDAPAMQ